MLCDPFKREGFIVNSLTDDDFYKFSMLNFIREYGLAGTWTIFSFRNRTEKVPLGHIIDVSQLQHEIRHVKTLRFTETELRYLGGHFVSEQTKNGEVSRRMFGQEFIDSLREYKLSDYRILPEDNGTITINSYGSWFEATLWEMHVLQIVAELYFESLIAKLSVFERQAVWAEAQKRLLYKVQMLKKFPYITITDFGTRRRACLAWQKYATEVLLNELGPGQYRGTSNVMLSMEHLTVPMGTFAHELVTAMSGINHATNDDIVASQNKTFDMWWNLYGQPLSVALSDTYGTDFFLRSFGAERAHAWKGTRQDSGDPFGYGEKMIAYYKQLGIDPLTKLIVFSDGLDVDTIVELAGRFRGRINVTFGWGTNLTNDFGPDFEPLSLVMKMTSCNGHDTVKLSDNLAKAMGKSDDIERFKRIFGYKEKYSQSPRY